MSGLTRDEREWLEGRLNAIADDVSGLDGKVGKITDDHEVRLRKLERNMYMLFGIGIAGGTVSSSIIGAIVGGG